MRMTHVVHRSLRSGSTSLRVSWCQPGDTLQCVDHPGGHLTIIATLLSDQWRRWPRDYRWTGRLADRLNCPAERLRLSTWKDVYWWTFYRGRRDETRWKVLLDWMYRLCVRLVNIVYNPVNKIVLKIGLNLSHFVDQPIGHRQHTYQKSAPRSEYQKTGSGIWRVRHATSYRIFLVSVSSKEYDMLLMLFPFLPPPSGTISPRMFDHALTRPLSNLD